MTVYVDDIREYASGPWCHLWTDGELDELHRLADKIGLKREWFQQKNPRFLHYDLRPSKRQAALRVGAVRMPLRQWIEQRMKRADGHLIPCPNCDSEASLIKVGPGGMEYRCGVCQAVTVKVSDEAYTDESAG